MALLPFATAWNSCLSFYVCKHVLPVCFNAYWSCSTAVFELPCVPAYAAAGPCCSGHFEHAQSNTDRQQHKQHTALQALHQLTGQPALQPCVCLSMSVCLSACLPVCLCLPACLPACLPVCLPADLSVCLSARMHICLSVCMSICLSAWPSICPHARLSARPPVCLVVRLYVI